jgi:hypothetical protein
MITYEDWRQRYVRPYEAGLYVAYNVDSDMAPEDAVTVSEASGYFRVAGTKLFDQIGLCVLALEPCSTSSQVWSARKRFGKPPCRF